MPVLDGPSFLTRLRGGGSSLPVIVLSADIQSSSKAMCEELGINGFLNKPWKAPDLLRVVSEAVASLAAVR
jgi:CheY-like chemotaxis protein